MLSKIVEEKRVTYVVHTVLQNILADIGRFQTSWYKECLLDTGKIFYSFDQSDQEGNLKL